MFDHRIDAETTIKTLEPAEAEQLFATVDSNRDHLRPWMPWIDANTTIEHSRRFIEAGQAQDDGGGGFHAAIHHRGAIVGVIGFASIDQPNRTAEIGYWAAEASQGKGLVTRATAAVIDHAFEFMGIHRIEIRCDVANPRSRAVAKRLGFAEEGTLSQAYWVREKVVDLVVYGMLAKKWRGEREAKSANHKAGRI